MTPHDHRVDLGSTSHKPRRTQPVLCGRSARHRVRRRPRIWPRLLVVLIMAAIASTGCGGGSDSWGPPGSGLSSQLAHPGSPATMPPPSRTATSRIVTTSGAQPPPSQTVPAYAFDPCTVIGWDQFPEAVRRPDRRPPQPQSPPPGAQFRYGCLWDSRGSDSKDPQTGNERHDNVSVVVIFWGQKPALSTLPADHAQQGGAGKTFAGREGVQIPGTTRYGERTCTSYMPVKPDPGVAGVSVAYSDPNIEPCAVAGALLEAIAAVVP